MTTAADFDLTHTEHAVRFTPPGETAPRVTVRSTQARADAYAEHLRRNGSPDATAVSRIVTVTQWATPTPPDAPRCSHCNRIRICRHCGGPIGHGLAPDEWWHVIRHSSGRTVFSRRCGGTRTSTVAEPKEN